MDNKFRGPQPQPGDRVIAYHYALGDRFGFLGEGTYYGDLHVPVEINKELSENANPTPLIILDNGKEIWGCECWYAKSELLRSCFRNLVWEEIDIDDVRGFVLKGVITK